MKNAVAYCRVDGPVSENMVELLNAQKCRLKAYAQKCKINIANFYEDTGYPRYIAERPGLQRMLNDARRGLFDTVLVINRDHLFRGNPETFKNLPFKIRPIDSLLQELER